MIHNLAVEMPGRMSQDRHRDREPDEQQQEADRQDRRDDQSSQRHGERIRQYGPDGSQNGDRDVYITVEKQWERDDTDAQGHHGKDEPDRGAESDQFPALWRAEDIGDELYEGSGGVDPKRHVKRLGREFSGR